MLINTYLDTEDFVHLYYPEDEPPAAQGCGAGARMASKYPPRPPSPEYSQVASSSSEMSERERHRASPQPEQPPHRVRAADLYPRLRTHYDEPGLDVGFTPICGEFVQWVGRTADGGTIAMSNYRLHAQPRRRSGPGASMPLRTIDAVEIRDLLHLLVFCKHGRTLKCKFNTSEQCLEWWRRLNGALAPIGSLQETFAAAYAAWAKEQPPASVHKALIKASQAPQRHWFGEELERLGFTTNGAWRVTAVNADYKLCDSYPPLLIVPASIGDDELTSVARFRSMRRVPAAVWRHRGTGAVLARSSQPEVGWLGWRSSEDERLLAAYVSACTRDAATDAQPHKQVKLLILDARSYASAVTNRARGGGCECQQYYTAADIQFMSLPNIHHVRKSFQQMRALAAEPGDQPNWHSNLERTLWLQYLCGVCRAASVAARAVLAGRPVLVHCSDGWDRTPQILATAQLILDPHYRTLEGFRVLIEREWLDFGHKFADRCGHQFGPEDPNERSPIFLQWLEVVYQMMYQYPSSFEFNESYLIKLATHVHSCMFGTFLCNKARERSEARAAECTAHVWQLLRAPAYRNHLYCAPHTLDQVLWPETNIRAMQFWWSMYGSEREELDDDHPEPDVSRQKHAPTNGLMTKTRSCDNLLNEGEKRTAQRRSSDPSLAPDVMKLSSMMVGGEVRAALTDSFVDDLPALPTNNHNQVEGLRPDHFENQRLSHDIASGSSSLERELAGATNIDKVIDHAIDDDSTDNCESVDKREDAGDVTDGTPPCTVVVKNGDDKSPEETPDEPIFVYDSYGDVAGMAEAARETGRSRHISITWRSVSESSNQSSNGFDIGDTPPKLVNDVPGGQRGDRPLDPALDNHNSTEGDVANHNVISELIEQIGDDGTSTVPTNHVDGLPSKNLEVQLNKVVRSSSVSSESSGEGSAGGAGAGGARRARVPSQLTLCPASPRRRCCRCCHCPPHHRTARTRPDSLTSGIETSGDSGGSEACWCGAGAGGAGSSSVRCVCGAGSSDAAGGVADPLDGLAPTSDRMQARLHQIILSQKKLVDGLMVELRQAKELLRQVTSQAEESEAPNATPPPRTPQPSAPPHPQSDGSANVNGSASCGSGSGTGSASRSRSGSSSGSCSASEVEVGEEARGVVWVPDSAAPRCQYCRNHFWLARRRHHCRRCGGIFCSSCSEMSAWGECGAVRVCRTCRER